MLFSKIGGLGKNKGQTPPKNVQNAGQICDILIIIVKRETLEKNDFLNPKFRNAGLFSMFINS